MKSVKRKTSTTLLNDNWAQRTAFWLSASLLLLIPLTFSSAVYRIYALPKFALLLIGTSALLPVVILAVSAGGAGELLRLFKSKHAIIVIVYIALIAISTIFSADPVGSLFGSSYNHMGLITHLGFVVCFAGLVIGIGESEERLRQALWVMTFAGLAASLYAFAQFFGIEPFVATSIYTFNSASGPVVRPSSTLGHANYLGNFLLYTTPLSAGLALASRGGARMIALVAVALSICAIAFSGTRGAWLGIGVGAVVFAFLELHKRVRKALQEDRKGVARKAALVFAIIVIAVSALSLVPASRNIVVRARSLITEGFTGAGRTLLWRDSLRMVPSYALTGTGPEGFRKAFLSYRSKDLARYAPEVNNESSHNSYLDAAISYGLPGAILYIAIIASTFWLLVGARRREESAGLRIIIAGIISSLVAVVVHNNFIYDQVSTGLCFFAFVALALAVSNVIAARESAPAKKHQATDKRERADRRGCPVKAAVAVASLITVMSLWYAVALFEADSQIKNIIAAAGAGDFDRMVRHRAIALNSPEPTVNYDSLFIRILTAHASRFPAKANSDSVWKRALSLLAQDANRQLAHSFTPESDYTLLAYLALLARDSEHLRAYATEAVKLDPNFFEAHWLMSESYLLAGDREQAVEEAELALAVHPTSQQARSVLRRAQGREGQRGQASEQLLARSFRLIGEGNIPKAQQLLSRAIRKSKGPCPGCRRAQALVYEATGKYGAAIVEWQNYVREDPEGAASEQIEARIESLKQRMESGQGGN